MYKSFNILFKCLALLLMSASLLSCVAENFFSEGDTVNVSGTFTLSQGQYLDEDEKGDSSANGLNSSQGVDGPATIGGYVSASDDDQDCYRVTNIDDGDEVNLSPGDGISEISLVSYGNERDEVSTDTGEDIDLQLNSAEVVVCVEIESGEGLYSLEIENSEASSVSVLDRLTVLLVDTSDDSVRDSQEVTPVSTNQYEYSLSGLNGNSYRVYISSDLDNDNIYCEEGEICGELSVGTLDADLTDQDSSTVEICQSSCDDIDDN